MSNTKQLFLNAIADDKPVHKLFKFRFFLHTNRSEAQFLVPDMLNLALSKKLIGEYELIFRDLKQSVEKVPEYQEQREKMVELTNGLRKNLEHAESIGNLEDMSHGYLKLADEYRERGMHEEAVSNYNKLFRTEPSNAEPIVKRDRYFSNWAQEMWLNEDRQDLNMFLRCQLEDLKKVDSTLALVKDLKLIELDSSKIFENILAENVFKIDEILANKILSQQDLGLIFSIVILASKPQKEIRNLRIKWSAKVETFYLKHNYRGLLNSLEDHHQQYGRFNPFTCRIYSKIYPRIRERMLTEYLGIFTEVSFEEIRQNVNYGQAELKEYLNNNPNAPYLLKTNSVVYHQKHVDLEQEVKFYHEHMKVKHNECLNSYMRKELKGLNERKPEYL